MADEYTSKKIWKLPVKKGIYHQHTVPKTLEQKWSDWADESDINKTYT